LRKKITIFAQNKNILSIEIKQKNNILHKKCKNIKKIIDF